MSETADNDPDDFREDNRLTGRARRYARVSTSVGGVATRLAADRLFSGGKDRDRSALAKDLRLILGNLKGPVMKVAQILSTIPDALPEEFSRELAQLQSSAPAMGWTFVRRRMKTELGADWQSKFKEFGREAAAAASLGQVHKAVALDGRQVAVKLQYPDMASAVEADLKQLNMLMGLYRRYDRSIDGSLARQELADRLREELDYDLEARHIRLYSEMLKKEPNVHVPETLGALCTDRLLTMTWLDGRPLLDFKQAPIEVRNQIAENLFRAWYVPFHRYGIIHGDPHLGNYTAREDYGLNLLDFGCIRVFPVRFVEGVLELYEALRLGERDRAVHAYELWGFSGLSDELIDVLNVWASFLYGPLMEDRPRLINNRQETGQYGAEVAAKVHKQLKELGPVTVPREFVFMDRAAIGLGGVFLHLKAEINWHRLFIGLVEDFSRESLAARQAAVLEAAGLEPAGD